MITYESGDLLESDAEALVNTVNCVGVMGKGLARQFRIKYPYMFLAYKDVCTSGAFLPGGVHWYYDRTTGKMIYNLATKDHWRDPSRLQWVENGLEMLANLVRMDGIKSIAIPPLGCGLGGLDWADVEPLIISAFGDADVRVDLYPPVSSQ